MKLNLYYFLLFTIFYLSMCQFRLRGLGGEQSSPLRHIGWQGHSTSVKTHFAWFPHKGNVNKFINTTILYRYLILNVSVIRIQTAGRISNLMCGYCLVWDLIRHFMRASNYKIIFRIYMSLKIVHHKSPHTVWGATTFNIISFGKLIPRWRIQQNLNHKVELH